MESKNTGEMIQLNRAVLNLYSVLKAHALEKYYLGYSILFFQADLIKYYTYMPGKTSQDLILKTD